jgi:hypothetical protein
VQWRSFLRTSAILHPRAKKYDEKRWQARLTHDWRFYFCVEGDTYIPLAIMAHLK